MFNWILRLFKKKEEIPTVVTPPKLDLKYYKLKLNIKSLCYYEKITGKSFFVFDGENVTELLYALFVVNNPDVVITLKTFMYMLEDTRLTKWLMTQYQSISETIQQFNSPLDEGTVSGDETDKPISITDYATSLIIDYGVDPEYVMYKMDIWEITEYYEAVATKIKRGMEDKRFWTYLQIMPHIDSKKCKKPEDLISFKWEKGDRKKRSEQEMERNMYAIKNMIGKNIFGDKKNG